MACGVTHASVVTLDVAKVRSQAHGSSGKWPKGLFSSIQKTWQAEGAAGVTKGWVPTFWGYGAQGLFKFGLNEFFKDYFTNMLGGPDKLDTTSKKMLLWAAASGSAEVVADVFLCPFEMTKVRLLVYIPKIVCFGFSKAHKFLSYRNRSKCRCLFSEKKEPSLVA